MEQHELALPFHELSGAAPLLSVRMVKEYSYCPPRGWPIWNGNRASGQSPTTPWRIGFAANTASVDYLNPLT